MNLSDNNLEVLFMKRFKRFVFAVALMLFSATLPLGAEAHYLAFVPNTSNVSVGSEFDVKLSFTHEFVKAQWGTAPGMSVEALEALIQPKLMYSDGSTVNITGFTEKKEPGTTTQMIDDKGTVRVIDRSSITSRIKIAKSGTAILSAKGNMAMGQFKMWMSAKHVLNAAEDGMSTKRVLGDETIEIVPMQSVNSLSVGQPAKFKVYLNGKPLVGADIEWADALSKTVIKLPPAEPMGEGDENLEELGSKTDSEGAFSFTPRTAGLFGLGVKHMTKEGDYTLAYMSSIILDARGGSQGHGSSGGGSSGCDAGFGALAVVLAGFAGFALNRRK